ncbi:hypothetical protein [Bosea thiooxidans]
MELTTAQKVIVASVVILVLLALLGLFVRQIQGGRLRVRGQAGGRQRQPRLGIVDTYDLDRQRQLVLIRRDNVEHLIMVGGASDVVVETNILRSGARATAPAYSEAAMADRPLPPFETLVPPSEPALRAGDEIRRGSSAPAPEILPHLPTRQSHAEAAAAVAGAGVAAALGLDAVGSAAQSAPAHVAPPVPPLAAPIPAAPIATGPAPSFPREHAPAPAVSADELDDMTKQLEAALKRPFSAVRPANISVESHAEPVVVPPKPAVSAAPESVVQPPKPADQPKSFEQAKPVEQPKPVEPVKPAQPIEPAKPVEPPKAPEAPAPAARPSSIAVDMEAELAAALGLKPGKAEPKPSEPKPPEADRGSQKPAAEKPVPAEAIAPAVVAEPAKPVAVEEVEPQKPAASEPEKQPEPTKEIDPFSVDAIEAEFARLLGRDPKSKS